MNKGWPIIQAFTVGRLNQKNKCYDYFEVWQRAGIVEFTGCWVKTPKRVATKSWKTFFRVLKKTKTTTTAKKANKIYLQVRASHDRQKFVPTLKQSGVFIKSVNFCERKFVSKVNKMQQIPETEMRWAIGMNDSINSLKILWNLFEIMKIVKIYLKKKRIDATFRFLWVYSDAS